uniref:Uncharacterized protein n=2 Tax=Biomphalaria glabrata TaxID=6526 RepID=A0A2C9K4F5_BIOGL
MTDLFQNFIRMQPSRTPTLDQMGGSEQSEIDDNGQGPHIVSAPLDLSLTQPYDMASTRHGWSLTAAVTSPPNSSNNFTSPIHSRHNLPPLALHSETISSNISTAQNISNQSLESQTHEVTHEVTEQPVNSGNPEDFQNGVQNSGSKPESNKDIDDKGFYQEYDENMNIISFLNNNASCTPEYQQDQNEIFQDRDLSQIHFDRCLTLQRSSDCFDDTCIGTSKILIGCESPKVVTSSSHCDHVFVTWQQNHRDVSNFTFSCLAPPIWTSLALRDNVSMVTSMVNPVPRVPVIRNGITINPDNMFEPIRDRSSEDLRGSSRCRSRSSEDAFSFESRRTSVDLSTRSSALDYCDECRLLDASDEDELVDVGLCPACHYRYSPMLSDLESFLAMLPSFGDRMDSPLIEDLMQHQDYMGGEGQRETIRPSNPVAESLRHGGSEHFLPLDIDYVLQDAVL